MKIQLFSCPSVLLCLAASALAGPPVVVERGPHHRVWTRVNEQTLPGGRVVARTNTYVEIATGLHYWKDGQWQESREEIELLADGGIARQGPHQVVFGANLNAPGAVTTFTTDGQRLRSHILGLAYVDVQAGRNCLIAEVKDSVGELVAPNQVLYRDAFTDLKADVRYTYTRAGMEQDVILRECPPPPERYGFRAGETLLQVWTELLEPPSPRLRRGGAGTNQPLVRIDFGAMHLGRGRAFEVEEEQGRGGLPALGQPGVPIEPAMKKLEGRDFLIESVPYPAMAPRLEKLPKAPDLGAAAGREPRAVAQAVRERKARLAAAPAGRPGQRAAAALGRGEMAMSRGVVLDYVLLNEETSDFTFQGDTTYLVSGPVILGGLTVLEGGAVLKYTNGAQIKITGTLACQTSPYRPALFTALDDDTVGEIIAGSTGSPTNYYAAPALYFETVNSDLHDVRFAYAAQAVWYDYDNGIPHRLAHAQLLHCRDGLVLNSSRFSLRNVLCAAVRTNFLNTGYSTSVAAEHLTLDQAEVMNSSANITLWLTNCLLVAVGTPGDYAGAHNASNASSAAVFQTVGAGQHYLAQNSPYRDAGTTNIHPKLWADLKVRTTEPPVVLSNVVSVDTVFGPRAIRDWEAPDLGYHYDPLDYTVHNLIVTNATLLLTNGVAVGLDGATNFHLQSGSLLVSEGEALRLNRLVAGSLVQEAPAAESGLGGTFSFEDGSFPRPQVWLRFSDVSVLGSRSHVASGAMPTNLAVLDSQLRGGHWPLTTGAEAAGATLSVDFFNTLWERSSLHLGNDAAHAPLAATFGHNLFRGGALVLTNGNGSNQPPWQIHDNVFDSVSLTNQGGPLTNSHNAYVGATALTNSLGGDQFLAAAHYQSGPLGPYYLPAHSPLVDAGSQNATNAGLFHFTTTLKQARETNSVVDIGLHYAAVDLATQTNTVWLDDNPGAGWATFVNDEDGDWLWVEEEPTPASGLNAHQSGVFDGLHQQYFYNASNTLSVGPGDTVFTHVYLDPEHLPATVMLQWYEAAGGWGHRAFWGPDNIGWAQKNYLGLLPLEGGWVRLEVPAEQVDLENRTLSGMAFVEHNGRATWDCSGKTALTGPTRLLDTDGDGLPDYLEDANGNGSYDAAAGETDWQTYTSLLGIGPGPGLKVFTPLK